MVTQRTVLGRSHHAHHAHGRTLRVQCHASSTEPRKWGSGWGSKVSKEAAKLQPTPSSDQTQSISSSTAPPAPPATPGSPRPSPASPVDVVLQQRPSATSGQVRPELVELAEQLGIAMAEAGWTNSCLPGSIMLHDILWKKYGLRSQLHLGYGLNLIASERHVWLECEGQHLDVGYATVSHSIRMNPEFVQQVNAFNKNGGVPLLDKWDALRKTPHVHFTEPPPNIPRGDLETPEARSSVARMEQAALMLSQTGDFAPYWSGAPPEALASRDNIMARIMAGK